MSDGAHDNLTSKEQGELPSEFWAAPEEVFTSQADQLMFADLLGRIRREVDESTGTTTIDYMRAERLVFVYCFIRLKERKKSFQLERNYKEMLQVWQSLANDHQKSTRAAFDPEEFRAGILTQVSKAIEKAVETLPEEQREVFLERVID